MIESVAKLHRRGYCHGDLKLNNWLVNEGGDIWLADFGNAYDPNDVSTQATQLHVLKNCSPEELLFANRCTYEMDVWTLGLALFRVFSSDRHLLGSGEHDRLSVYRGLISIFGKPTKEDLNALVPYENQHRKAALAVLPDLEPLPDILSLDK